MSSLRQRLAAWFRRKPKYHASHGQRAVLEEAMRYAARFLEKEDRSRYVYLQLVRPDGTGSDGTPWVWGTRGVKVRGECSKIGDRMSKIRMAWDGKTVDRETCRHEAAHAILFSHGLEWDKHHALMQERGL